MLKIHRFLCGTIALAVGAAASASVISFDNGAGVFVMGVVQQGNYPALPSGWLDITQPPTQSGTRIARSVAFNRIGPGASDLPAYVSVLAPGAPGAESQLAGGGVVYHALGGFGSPASFPWTAAKLFQAGDSVGPGELYVMNDVYVSSRNSASQGSGVTVFAQHGFVGVSILLSGQTHYGYVELIQLPAPGSDFFKVTSWGYETSANTPAVIPVPAPGCGVLLALGAVVGRRRRH